MRTPISRVCCVTRNDKTPYMDGANVLDGAHPCPELRAVPLLAHSQAAVKLVLPFGLATAPPQPIPDFKGEIAKGEHEWRPRNRREAGLTGRYCIHECIQIH